MRSFPETAADATAALQQAFAAALLSPQLEVPAGFEAASPGQRSKRFAVYRNNVHASLAGALAARFPVVQRLVGEEFFQATAVAFIRRQPPRSPLLLEYGSAFAAFLEDFAPARDLPYLPDVARLEWARNVAYHAADHVAVALAALAQVPAEALATVALRLHPAFGFVASPYPVLSIWTTNTHDLDVKPIGPQHGAECALVTRPDLTVLVTPLPAASAPFVATLCAGGTLGAAAAAASAAMPQFDLPATLAALFASGAISDIVISTHDNDPGAQS